MGLNACNDAALIESGIYTLIKQHLRGKPNYMEVNELIHEVFPQLNKKMNNKNNKSTSSMLRCFERQSTVNVWTPYPVLMADNQTSRLIRLTNIQRLLNTRLLSIHLYYPSD